MDQGCMCCEPRIMINLFCAPKLSSTKQSKNLNGYRLQTELKQLFNVRASEMYKTGSELDAQCGSQNPRTLNKNWNVNHTTT